MVCAQGCLKVWAEVAAHRPCDEQDPISTGFLGAPQRGRGAPRAAEEDFEAALGVRLVAVRGRTLQAIRS